MLFKSTSIEIILTSTFVLVIGLIVFLNGIFVVCKPCGMAPCGSCVQYVETLIDAVFIMIIFSIPCHVFTCILVHVFPKLRYGS